jgi:hypothetical protein
MKASDFEEPSYEEYWPNIDGLARRDQVTDEAMPSKTFFDIAVIHILTTSSINRLRELYPELDEFTKIFYWTFSFCYLAVSTFPILLFLYCKE